MAPTFQPVMHAAGNVSAMVPRHHLHRFVIPAMLLAIRDLKLAFDPSTSTAGARLLDLGVAVEDHELAGSRSYVATDHLTPLLIVITPPLPYQRLFPVVVVPVVVASIVLIGFGMRLPGHSHMRRCLDAIMFRTLLFTSSML